MKAIATAASKRLRATAHLLLRYRKIVRTLIRTTSVAKSHCEPAEPLGCSSRRLRGSPLWSAPTIAGAVTAVTLIGPALVRHRPRRTGRARLQADRRLPSAISRTIVPRRDPGAVMVMAIVALVLVVAAGIGGDARG